MHARRAQGRDSEIQPNQELLPRSRIVAEAAKHTACHHFDAVLVHAAGGYAGVRRLYHDGHSLRLQHRFDDVGDLRSQALLNLKALRIGVDDAGQLRNADDASPRQVADMREADDRGPCPRFLLQYLTIHHRGKGALLERYCAHKQSSLR